MTVRVSMYRCGGSGKHRVGEVYRAPNTALVWLPWGEGLADPLPVEGRIDRVLRSERRRHAPYLKDDLLLGDDETPGPQVLTPEREFVVTTCDCTGLQRLPMVRAISESGERVVAARRTPQM